MSSSDAVTCRTFADLVMDFLDGALPLAAREACAAHLAGCATCSAYLTGYRATVDLGKAHGGDAGDRPPDVPEDLVQSILAARRLKP
jgi:anti-sigma factor RsiW